MGIVLFTWHRKGHLANLEDLGKASTIGTTHLSWQGSGGMMWDYLAFLSTPMDCSHSLQAIIIPLGEND